MNKSILAGVVAAFALASGPVVAQDVEFTVINNSSVDIHYFYTTPSTQDTWGEDLLEELGILESGYQATAYIGDGSDQCLYDLKFIGENGEELVAPQVDICTLDSYTIED